MTGSAPVLESPEALRRLRAAVDIDEVLSAAQAARYCGVDVRHTSLRDAGLVTFTLLMVPIHMGWSSETEVTFVARRNIYRWMSRGQIGHLVGAAEMRHQLLAQAALTGADPGEWVTSASAVGKSEKPDATVAFSSGEVWAIEYDTGSYVGKKVDEKARTFMAEFDHVVWGCASELRARRLRRRFKVLHEREGTYPQLIEVLHCPWWV